MLKTCLIVGRFLSQNGVQNCQKVAQRAPKVTQRAPKLDPERVLKAKGAPRASQRPPEGHFWSVSGVIF